MPIHDRDLKPGTQIAARYKGETFSAEIVQSGDSIAIMLDDRSFSSLSAAGSAITGGTRVNGWVFWSLADELKPREPQQLREGRLKSSVVRLIRRVPNQRGTEDGTTRWWCSACMKSFVTQGTEEPAGCPDGHPRESTDEVQIA